MLFPKIPVPVKPIPLKIIGSLTAILDTLFKVIKLPVALVALTVRDTVVGVQANAKLGDNVDCTSIFCTALEYA